MLTVRKMSVYREQLQPADHICTDRKGGLYAHHGIYVGKAKVTNPYDYEQQEEIDDAVIHFFGPPKTNPASSFISSSSSSSSFASGLNYRTYQCQRCFYQPAIHGVVISCLDCFLDGNSLYICDSNNWYRDPPDVVIKRAFSVLEKEIYFPEYHVVSNNCEHFASYCKTGTASSLQVAVVATACSVV